MGNKITDFPETAGDVVSLDGFEVYRQETDHTCGPCAVRMILKYLGGDIPEKKIARKCLTHPLGTLHWTLLAGFRKFLEPLGYGVNMVEDCPDIYLRMKAELSEGRPVMFVYCVIDEFHPPKKVSHYGVAIGINETEGKIRIANPFGHIEDMDISEWWERFSLDEKYLPRIEGFFYEIGIFRKRTAFIIEAL